MVHVRLELELSVDNANAKRVIDKLRQDIRISARQETHSLEGKWIIRGQHFDFYNQEEKNESRMLEVIQGSSGESSYSVGGYSNDLMKPHKRDDSYDWRAEVDGLDERLRKLECAA